MYVTDGCTVIDNGEGSMTLTLFSYEGIQLKTRIYRGVTRVVVALDGTLCFSWKEGDGVYHEGYQNKVWHSYKADSE